MILTSQKADNLGAITSMLCLVHCVASPFLFIFLSSATTCCEGVPSWWGFLDYFFLIISFFAVYRSTQTTSKNWIKPALWLSFMLLFVVIVNEKIGWFALGEKFIFIPTTALVILHLYNKKYCQCNQNACCTHEG